MQQLQALYEEWCGKRPTKVERLPGAGSNRVYYRLFDKTGQSVIGVVGTSRDENQAFVYLAQHFSQCQLPVPQVLAVSGDALRYLQTDLGSVSLFDAIRTGRELGGAYSQEEQHLLLQAIGELPRLQFCGAKNLDFTHCYPQPTFDIEGIFFDLNYFKYCFLKATDIDFHELKLEVDFHALANDLTSESSYTFLYRDFQARNIMLFGGRLYYIDFQGGRCGPFYYDIASFLWQASARYSSDLRKKLIDHYYLSAQQYAAMPSRDDFDKRLLVFVFFRTLQVLGAYGFRGYFERKKHFIDSIPPALQNMQELLAAGVANPYPHLEDVLRRLVKLPQFLNNKKELMPLVDVSKPSLVVKVFSFSYKKGIPEDDSGNGGGYVFDCRSTHNPGRYEPYKNLTGMDEPVIRFLEEDGEILTFLESVYKLADAHVTRYIERGFTSLMFSFGCTGGQHRSVYSAQHLAEHIHRKFGVVVHLCHREQGIEKIFR